MKSIAQAMQGQSHLTAEWEQTTVWLIGRDLGSPSYPGPQESGEKSMLLTLRSLVAALLLVSCCSAQALGTKYGGSIFYAPDDMPGGMDYMPVIQTWVNKANQHGLPMDWDPGTKTLNGHSLLVFAESDPLARRAAGAATPFGIAISEVHWLGGIGGPVSEPTKLKDVVAFFALQIHERAHIQLTAYQAFHCFSLPSEEQAACRQQWLQLKNCMRKKLGNKQNPCSEAYAEAKEAMGLCAMACCSSDPPLTPEVKSELISQANAAGKESSALLDECGSLVADCGGGAYPFPTDFTPLSADYSCDCETFDYETCED